MIMSAIFDMMVATHRRAIQFRVASRKGKSAQRGGIGKDSEVVKDASSITRPISFENGGHYLKKWGPSILSGDEQGRIHGISRP